MDWQKMNLESHDGVADKRAALWQLFPEARTEDSRVEQEFARQLDQREDIKLFLKLPTWFKVETPLGGYNPDWAVVKQGDETLYLIRETKGTHNFLQLRTTEADKIRCGQAHFAALGVNFKTVVLAAEV